MTERVDLDRLLAELEPRVAMEFQEAIQRHASQIDLAALRDALARGDVAEAERIANIEAPSLFPFSEILRAAFFGAAFLAGRRQKGPVGQFRFDGRHPEAEAWVSRYAADLVTAITDESRQSVRAVILDGLQKSRAPASIARDIAGKTVGGQRVGGIIGLTSPQTDTIIKARYALASGDVERLRWYLGLKTRDRRFDAMIRKAIRERRPIKGTELERILAAHKAKAIKARAALIAKKETFTATAEGRHQAYRQMLGAPGVTGVSVRWQHNLSAEPRVDHVAMSGTVVQIDQPFVFPDGTAMLHPHDANAPINHTAGCRCIGVYRVQVEKG